MNSLPVEINAVNEHIQNLLSQAIAENKVSIYQEKIIGYGHAYYFLVKIFKIYGRHYVYCGTYTISSVGIKVVVANPSPGYTYSLDYTDLELMQKLAEVLGKMLR